MSLICRYLCRRACRGQGALWAGIRRAGLKHCPCCTQGTSPTAWQTGTARGERQCRAPPGTPNLPSTFLALMWKAVCASLLLIVRRQGRRRRVALCCRSSVPQVRLACKLCSLHSKFCFQVQRVLRLCVNGPAKDIF